MKQVERLKCPKCDRQYNPKLVNGTVQDPGGRCPWCAVGVVVGEKRKGPEPKEVK